MQVIMLNFMIAVIMTTYERVINGNMQVVIGYKHKADLNFETYMLISTFKKLRKYRCIVFASAKDQFRDGNSEFIEMFDNLKRNVAKKFNDVKAMNVEIEKNFHLI